MNPSAEGYAYGNRRYLDQAFAHASAEKPRPAWPCLLRVKAQVSGKGKPFYRLTFGDRRLILLEEAGSKIRGTYSPDGRAEMYAR
jgi:hypothetical protein